MTCHGNPARSEWMQPSLDQPANTFPEWLPKLADREIDVAFTGCVARGILLPSEEPTAGPPHLAIQAVDLTMSYCPTAHTRNEAHKHLLGRTLFAKLSTPLLVITC